MGHRWAFLLLAYSLVIVQLSRLAYQATLPRPSTLMAGPFTPTSRLHTEGSSSYMDFSAYVLGHRFLQISSPVTQMHDRTRFSTFPIQKRCIICCSRIKTSLRRRTNSYCGSLSLASVATPAQAYRTSLYTPFFFFAAFYDVARIS